VVSERSNKIALDNSRRPHERRPALVFLRGELLAASIPLDRDEIILGRALEAHIRLNDARASRLHARLTIEHGGTTGETRYRVTDLGSTNGTFVNGRRVTESFLQDGDKLTLGEHLLRFELLDDIDQEFQRQIHRLLAHDELTGLLSSKSFFSELRREAARAAREDLPFCVLMMDLDHFKNVNDTYGHLVGSQTLKEVGAIITRSLRAGDGAARFGGEEFAAFLLDADSEQGIAAAKRVCSAIESHGFSASHRSHSTPEGDQTFHISISIGLASSPDDSRDPIELVQMADTALYHAKQLGRNCVCPYRVAPSPPG